MTQIAKATWLMWICFALCAISPLLNAKIADSMEELAATAILLALALVTNKIIAWLMLFLATGKVIDGLHDPYNPFGGNEFLWDILAFTGAIIMYLYRKRKKLS